MQTRRNRQLCHNRKRFKHHNDIMISAMASQITGVLIVCSSVGSGADQRIHQSSASLAFVWGIHRWPVNSPLEGPMTWKMFPFDDAIVVRAECSLPYQIPLGNQLEENTLYIYIHYLQIQKNEGIYVCNVCEYVCFGGLRKIGIRLYEQTHQY